MSTTCSEIKFFSFLDGLRPKVISLEKRRLNSLWGQKKYHKCVDEHFIYIYWDLRTEILFGYAIFKALFLTFIDFVRLMSTIINQAHSVVCLWSEHSELEIW